MPRAVTRTEHPLWVSERKLWSPVCLAEGGGRRALQRVSYDVGPTDAPENLQGAHRHVDVFRRPERALADGIFMTPTFVRLGPFPIRRVVDICQFNMRRVAVVVVLLGNYLYNNCQLWRDVGAELAANQTVDRSAPAVCITGAVGPEDIGHEVRAAFAGVNHAQCAKGAE
jgi:hypothetical protein